MNSIKTYLCLEYGIWYDNAENDEKRKKLYFDPRGWTNADIKAFFEDLRFGDYATYEKCILMFPKRRQTSMKGLRKAQKRYITWLENNNKETE